MFLSKFSYWLGYMVGKADSGELTVKISDEDMAQAMIERNIVEGKIIVIESDTGDSNKHRGDN